MKLPEIEQSTIGVGEYSADWYRPGSGPHVSLTASFEGRTPQYADVLRIACHHIIEQLPDEGLEELSQSLDEMTKYYAGKELYRQSHTLRFTSTAPALSGEKFVREHFQLTEL